MWYDNTFSHVIWMTILWDFHVVKLIHLDNQVFASTFMSAIISIEVQYDRSLNNGVWSLRWSIYQELVDLHELRSLKKSQKLHKIERNIMLTSGYLSLSRLSSIWHPHWVPLYSNSPPLFSAPILCQLTCNKAVWLLPSIRRWVTGPRCMLVIPSSLPTYKTTLF